MPTSRRSDTHADIACAVVGEATSRLRTGESMDLPMVAGFSEWPSRSLAHVWIESLSPAGKRSSRRVYLETV